MKVVPLTGINCINALDKETLDLVLATFYSAIVKVSLIDLSCYKEKQKDFDLLNEKYLQEYSKYTDEELDALLKNDLSNVEYEKIISVRALRNKGGNHNDNEALF